MAHIVTTRIIRQKTEIRCSLEERKFLDKKLSRTKYQLAGLFNIGGDYMIGSKSDKDYEGHVVTIVADDVERHNKLVNLVTGWLLKNGSGVKAETQEYVEGYKYA